MTAVLKEGLASWHKHDVCMVMPYQISLSLLSKYFSGVTQRFICSCSGKHVVTFSVFD